MKDLTQSRTILLLGTRGIPAAHGGFETFVEFLAPWLADRGWKVYVYCQEEGEGAIWTSSYRGVTLVNIPTRGNGTASTIIFDWRSMQDALKREGLLLSFGYPTGAFAILPKLKNRRHIINMDGIEWKRSQFGLIGKIAYYLNERFAAALGDRLIADHPKIAEHLATRVSSDKITTIAYGAESLSDVDEAPLASHGLLRDQYAVIIARPEPDNSILELVAAFSRRVRGKKLVVLGKFNVDNAYHKRVRSAASREVIFPGAIYDKPIVQSLRKYARFYAHGHRVGGTNPSLVEAMGAGNAILAHNNPFNRCVAQSGAVYFSDEEEVDRLMTKLFSDDKLVARLRTASTDRFESALTWPKILGEYDLLLTQEASCPSTQQPPTQN